MSPRARVLRALRGWINKGHMPAGERLPTQEALASKFNVSRMVIRSALTELEQEGLVQVRKRQRLVGQPNRAAETVTAHAMAILSDLPVEEPPAILTQTGLSVFTHAGVASAIRRRGLHVLLLHPDRLSQEQIDRLAADGLRGVIFHELREPSSHSTDHLRALGALKAAGIPVAGAGYGPEVRRYDTVASDQEAGCYALTKWLIRRGQRRILRVWRIWLPTEDRPAWLEDRDAGFARAMREAGLEILPLLRIPCPRQSDWPDTYEKFEFSFRQVAGYLLEHVSGPQSVDAIMASSDGDVSHIAAACRLLGRQPNTDIAIVGYDNYWADCPERRWEAAAPLATVDKHNMQIGEAMVDLLADRLAGTLPEAPQRRLVPPELVILEKGAAGPARQGPHGL